MLFAHKIACYPESRLAKRWPFRALKCPRLQPGAFVVYGVSTPSEPSPESGRHGQGLLCWFVDAGVIGEAEFTPKRDLQKRALAQSSLFDSLIQGFDDFEREVCANRFRGGELLSSHASKY